MTPKAAQTLLEILIAAALATVAIPSIWLILSGHERETRWSARLLDVASTAQGRLGELEGQLQASGFARKPIKGSRTFDLESGDAKLPVEEVSAVEPLAGGLFLLSLEFSWREVSQESTTRRQYRTSLVVLDPDTGLRDAPTYAPPNPLERVR